MHYCLRIPEIADLICKKVHWEDYDGDGDFDLLGSDLGSKMPRCATLALAQTCKHFYEPAMSALWNSLDDLRPLIRCLDRALYDIEETMVLRRPIYASDIEIMKKYTHRIRHLHISEHLPSLTVPVEVYHALTIHFGGRLWIPKLHTLELNLSGDSNSILPFVGFIMGPHLNTFKVWAEFSSYDGECDLTLASLLTTIPSRLPRLTSVDFSLLQGMSSAVSTFVQQCHHLVHLEVEMLDRLAIRHLSTLSSLGELRIIGGLKEHKEMHENVIFDMAGLSDRDETPIFPALRKLTFTNLGELSPNIRFFSYLKQFFFYLRREIRLTDLQILLDDGDDWSLEGIQELVQVVAGGVAEETLLSLSIIVYGDPNEDYSNPVVSSGSMGILKPLTKFKQLESLIITTRPQPYISDNDVEELCSAWPKLLSLQISNAITDSPHPGESITLQAVISAASSCPKLGALSLAFDARQDKLPDAEKPISRMLTSLHVGNSYIDNFTKVAHLLYKMFPRLCVKTDPNLDDDYEELELAEPETEWGKVEALMKRLRLGQSKLARKKGKKQRQIQTQASVN